MTGTGRSAMRTAQAWRQDDLRMAAARRRIDGDATPTVRSREDDRSTGIGSIGWMRRRILGHA